VKRDVLMLAAAFAVSGCSAQDWPDSWRRWPGPDEAIALVPWFSTMHYGIAIQPYRTPMPRPPVEGTIPVTGNDPPLPVIPANLPAINALSNPLARTAAVLEAGKAQYEIYCLPCHGTRGAGDGPVDEKLLVTPSLLTDQARRYTEGYLYAIIRHGRGIMPAYGDRITSGLRWAVVHYVRQLQGIAP
jgi:mono/diheme cytochrome c family protein